MHVAAFFSVQPAHANRRVPAAMSIAGFSNRSLPAKGFRNIPSDESDESLIEVVQVHDPRHPLYGQSFRVIGRAVCRGSKLSPTYEVKYRRGGSLLIPISVTEPYDKEANQTKLSIEALCELVSAAEVLECHEHGSERSLGDAATRSAPPNRRRRRGSSGGALP
jgi:hypothetical protein